MSKCMPLPSQHTYLVIEHHLGEEVVLRFKSPRFRHLPDSTKQHLRSARKEILLTLRSMLNRAIEKLVYKVPHLAKATFIVDGNIFRTNLRINYTCIEKADQKIKEVSCASIVAKVTRDYLMRLTDFLHPEWNFSKHKGYPTLEHFSLIKKYSLTPFHRRSFAPCK